MSWATTFWNLEYIVDSARRAMEAAYFAEHEAFAQADESVLNSPNANPLETSGMESDVPGDALKMMESALASNASPQPPARAAKDLLENLAVAMKKESLTTKQPMRGSANTELSSPWTPEIEAALRSFLRPLSMNLRHEYGFSDAFNEMRSIEAMNSLFKQPAKPDDAETRDLSARDEIRRKRNNELRRPEMITPKIANHR